MTRDLNGILDWFEQLRAVDTTGVEPMTSGLGLALRLRPDVVDDGGRLDQILSNAPQRTAGYFVVPKVVE